MYNLRVSFNLKLDLTTSILASSFLEGEAGEDDGRYWRRRGMRERRMRRLMARAMDVPVRWRTRFGRFECSPR